MSLPLTNEVSLPSTNEEALAHALAYASVGWRVVPCHTIVNGMCSCSEKTGCKGNSGKHPRSGTKWQETASADPGTITTWFRQYWPGSNVGVCTGPESRIFVLDIEESGIDYWRGLIQKYGDISPTPIVETGGGGYHIYFKWPDTIDIRNRVKSIFPGQAIDLRGRNGLAILPPSLHLKGGHYMWAEGSAPWEVQVSSPPDWLFAIISAACITTPGRNPLDTARVMAGVPVGERNDSIFRLASSLRSQEYTYTQARQLVLEAAHKCYDPNTRAPYPLEEKEAVGILDRVYQVYPAGRSWNFQQPYSRPTATAEGPWQKPISLDDANVPAFPVETLPTWVRRYVEEVAQLTGTSVDLAGMCSISALAACSAGKAKVQLRGWAEPLNLFAAICARPGSRKSAVFDYVASPIIKYEKHIRAKREEEIVRLKSRIEAMESEYKSARTRVAKADIGIKASLMSQLEEMALAIHRLKKTCVMPNLVVDDVTPENLKTQLYEQGGRIAALSPEGDIFGMMSGRYRTGGDVNIDVYVKGHCGDYIKVNRSSGREEVIYNPALTIGICTQKRSMRGMLQKHMLVYKGLFARFLYAMSPDWNLDPTMEDDLPDDPPPVAFDIASAYQANMMAIMSLPLPTDLDTAPTIHLSDDARRVFKEFEQAINKELARGLLSKSDELLEWGRKLAGAIGRIAGLFHMADNVTDGIPWDWEMAKGTMERACQVGTYLIPHAIVAFMQMDTSPSQDYAHRMLANLAAGPELQAFSRQDAVRWARKHGRELDEALYLLQDCGFIRPDGKNFLVNPEWDRTREVKVG